MVLTVRKRVREKEKRKLVQKTKSNRCFEANHTTSVKFVFTLLNCQPHEHDKLKQLTIIRSHFRKALPNCCKYLLSLLAIATALIMVLLVWKLFFPQTHWEQHEISLHVDKCLFQIKLETKTGSTVANIHTDTFLKEARDLKDDCFSAFKNKIPNDGVDPLQKQPHWLTIKAGYLSWLLYSSIPLIQRKRTMYFKWGLVC